MIVTADERRHVLNLFNVSEAARRLGVGVQQLQGDYFNRHLGTPSPESGFGQFYGVKFTPRQALNRWVKWHPHENEPLQFLLDISASREDLY